MPRYVQIAVNVPQVTGVFDYHLPEHLEKIIEIGHLVEVPFGAQHVQGVVVHEIGSPAVPETKAVLSLLTPETVIIPFQIALAEKLAEQSLVPLASWINLMLPTGVSKQADTLYTLIKPWQTTPRTIKQNSTRDRLLKILSERGPLRGSQIDRALPYLDWRPIARSLVKQNCLTVQSVLLEPTIQPKKLRYAELVIPAQEVQNVAGRLGKTGSNVQKRRQAMLDYLTKENKATLISWLYATSGGTASDIKKLQEFGIIRLVEQETWRDPLQDQKLTPSTPPIHTADQQICWSQIQTMLRECEEGRCVPPVLLHGVTGSGKTEIYLQAVAAILKESKQAIILVPEIALTPQATRRFRARFFNQVGLIHSQLSPGERYDTWRRVRSGELNLVIGPRSALFTPFRNLGLIVIDECHDESYYQKDPPFYNAIEVATTLCKMKPCLCILGSATPDVSSRFLAAQGQWSYLTLPKRISAHQQAVQNLNNHFQIPSNHLSSENEIATIDLPAISVVDMRQELKAGNRSIFSQHLHTSLAQVLENHQQAILFINRRGSATYIFCRDCGRSLKCPKCLVPLVLHLHPILKGSSPPGKKKLVCHHCGYQRFMPSECPNCQSTHIRQYGVGTERVEEEIKHLFPDARTLRWDYETTRHKGAHDLILQQVTDHKTDILIGTQMLAKGLDLPFVTLVGVILADVGLNLPDYRASERTYQVLSQVTGRAGRSPLGGIAILQTYQPDHYVIQAAATNKYERFYEKEIAFRKKLADPPFTEMVRLELRQTDAVKAKKIALEMGIHIREWLVEEGRQDILVSDPLPCFFSRLAGWYRWQIVIRGANLIPFFRKHNLGEWRVEVNPPSLL
jgi:primosomal protein N' (replication factor Y)